VSRSPRYSVQAALQPRGTLDREDIHAGVRLLIATFIVLPLLPNKPLIRRR
jgi:uncharacterized membrane protein (DUF4010 family)